MRVSLLCASLALASLSAQAVPRDRFARSVSLGASVGVGGPRGVAGAFVELRPWRALALGVGAGLGGSFGPGVDATLTLTPIGTRGWALGASAALSRQFMWSDSFAGMQLPPGRAAPSRSDWVSLGLVNEFRPSRSLMIRVGVGYSWLVNRGDFNVIRSEELSAADAVDVGIPGSTPLDAARAVARGQSYGVWFVHLDVAPSWRW